MVGLGLLYIPLKDVVGMLSWQYFVVVISVVLTVVLTGFFVGGKMNMNPIEAPIVIGWLKRHGRNRGCYPIGFQPYELDAVCPSSHTFGWSHHRHFHDILTAFPVLTTCLKTRRKRERVHYDRCKRKSIGLLKVKFGGKLEVISKVPIETMEDLSIAYTPGVAAVCMEIGNNKGIRLYLYNQKSCCSRNGWIGCPGLGNIGPEATSLLWKAKRPCSNASGMWMPFLFRTQDVEEIISHVAAIAPSFGGTVEL